MDRNYHHDCLTDRPTDGHRSQPRNVAVAGVLLVISLVLLLLPPPPLLLLLPPPPPPLLTRRTDIVYPTI